MKLRNKTLILLSCFGVVCLLVTCNLYITSKKFNHLQIAEAPQLKIEASATTSKVRMASKPTSLDVLVNKSYVLSSKYVPKNLTIASTKVVRYTVPGNQERNKVRKEVAQPLVSMMTAAKKQGLDIRVASAYRSFNRQKAIFNSNVASVGLNATLKVVAQPGRSEHQTGLAIDFTTKSIGFSLVEKFERTPEGKWLKANAHKYGFIMRYPKGKEKITGYSYEPWHFRYVGTKIAKEIYTKNTTFEQYKKTLSK